MGRSGGQREDARARRLAAEARDLLQQGRPAAALKRAEKALALRRRALVPSPDLLDALILVGDCLAAVGRPVSGVTFQADAVLLLADLVRDTESDPVHNDPWVRGISATIEAAVHGRSVDAAGLGREMSRLFDRVIVLVAPFESADPGAAEALLMRLGRSEIRVLPEMMTRVDEVALLGFQRGRHDLAQTLSRAVVTLGQASRRRGPAYRQPLNRALFDTAGYYKVAGESGEMWVWVCKAIDVATEFLAEPGDANLLIMADTLDVVSGGLMSAGLAGQAGRAQEIASSLREWVDAPHTLPRADLIAAVLPRVLDLRRKMPG